MNKTVSSVIDDINEWNGPNGTIYYVTAIFTDESVGSAGKKNYDAALEVQGLLREAIGVEQDFTLESKGQTKTGREKFAIKGFGTPGGAATYVAPGVQGAGGSMPLAQAGPSRGRSPEHDQFIQERMDRRTALMQAVAHDPEARLGTTTILNHADLIYAWLRETSDASSAYPQPVVAATGEPSTDHQAGASEDSLWHPKGDPNRQPPPDVSDSGVGVESEGKEPASPPHIHDWQPTGLHGKLKCEGCGEMRDREAL